LLASFARGDPCQPAPAAYSSHSYPKTLGRSPVLAVDRIALRLAGAACCFALAGTPAEGAAPAAPGRDNPVLQPGARAAWMPGEVIVKFRSPIAAARTAKTSGVAAVDAVFERCQVTAIERIARRAIPPRKPGLPDMTRVYRVRYAGAADAMEVARQLAALPEIEYAEPRFVYALALVPDDPSFATQSAYLNRMQFPTAWNTTTGGAVIAIADGGTDWDHVDLLANVWANPGETVNGLDDDDNGFIDDIRGWNFANGTNDPTGLPATPASANHGTHVAGICCAVANNTTGIAGASYNAKFMPICTASPTSDNAIAYGYDGIVYAAENGADVVNCSWGGEGAASSYELDVIGYATGLGTLVVAAAGNTGSLTTFYPAAYAQVLAVANVTNTDIRNTSTTYGPWVDVAAQGTSILSTLNSPVNGYGNLSGTSMASPHAAAVCALVKTRWPGYLAEQVRQRVRVTSDNIDAINPTAYKGNLGYGRVNAASALTKNTPAISVTSTAYTTSDGDDIIEPGETLTLNLAVTDWLASCSGLTFKLRENSVHATPVDSVAIVGGLDSLQTAALTPFTVAIAPTAPIQHTVTFTVAITATTPAYTDKSKFDLTVLPTFTTHDANDIACSVTSVGKLGFALTAGGTGADGIGFHYRGSPNYLFEGGLMIGTGPTVVSDGCRTTGAAQDDDFQTVAGGIPRVTEPAPPYDEKGVARFTDALAASPLGLEVRQESFEIAAPPYQGCILLRYHIRNTSGVARNGLRVGWFCDWDLDGGSYDTNLTGYDADRGMMHVHDTSAGGPDDYVGLLTLTAPGTTAARGIWNDETLAPDWGVYDGYTEAEKWETLSISPTHTAAGPADVSIGLGTGPFSLAPSDSMVVAFAFVGGGDLAELQANADAAMALYALLPTDAGGEVPAAPRRLAVDQNAPNPFNPSTTIAFDLPRATTVTLHVYAVDGRRVRTLVDGPRPAGEQHVAWDGRDDSGRTLASGTYFYRFTAEGKSLVRKMQLLK
jgi:hypothetical protein